MRLRSRSRFESETRTMRWRHQTMTRNRITQVRKQTARKSKAEVGHFVRLEHKFASFLFDFFASFQSTSIQFTREDLIVQNVHFAPRPQSKLFDQTANDQQIKIHSFDRMQVNLHKSRKSNQPTIKRLYRIKRNQNLAAKHSFDANKFVLFATQSAISGSQQ